MQVSITTKNLYSSKADALLVTVPGGDLPPGLRFIDGEMGGEIGRLVGDGLCGTDLEKLTVLFPPRGAGPDRLALVGLGEEAGEGEVRDAVAGAVRQLVSGGVSTLALDAGLEDPDLAEATVAGALLGGYRFRGHKSADDDGGLERVTVGRTDNCAFGDELRTAVGRGETLARAVMAARDLVNEPGNRLTPTDFARRAEAMAADSGLECTVRDEEFMKDRGMGLLLGVAAGSAEPPRLIELRYRSGCDDAPTLVLAGKGLTFDSGGISLKRSQGMQAMKMDMGGGAAVFGAMQAIADLKPPVNVVGLIAATENLPGGRALKPGDVPRACNDMTAEIISTDAEGRLALADAVAYADRELGCDWILDIATLTGAVSVALGDQAAGLVSTDDGFAGAVQRASCASGERVWRLPAYDEYREQLKSDVADLKNGGGRKGGAITGGLFIGAFSGDTPWAHLDIAGVAWTDKAKGERCRGGTGFGVRILTSLAFVLGE